MSKFYTQVGGALVATALGLLLAYDPGLVLEPPLINPDRAPAGILRNPDFDAADGWSSTGDWLLDAGVLKCVNSQSQFFYQHWSQYLQTPVTGVKYRLTIKINSIPQGGVRAVTNSVTSSQGLDITFYTAGLHTVEFIGDGDTFNLQSVNFLGLNCTCEIEYVQLTRL